MNLDLVRRSPRSKAYAALLLAVLLWGLVFNVVQYSTPLFSNIAWFLSARFSIACLTYTPFLFIRGGSLQVFRQLGRRGWLTAIAVASCLGVFYLFQTAAIEHKPANAAFLTGTVALWVPFFSFALRQTSKLPPVDTFIGIIASLFGLAILNGFTFSLDPKADTPALAGAFVLAFELIIVGAYVPSLGARALLAWTCLYTFLLAVFCAIVGIVWSPQSIVSQQWDGDSRLAILGVLYCGVCASATANYFANWANSAKSPSGKQLINATHRALIENLDAPIALAAAALLWHDPTATTTESVAGGGLILAGVLISETNAVTRLLRSMSSPKRSNVG